VRTPPFVSVEITSTPNVSEYGCREQRDKTRPNCRQPWMTASRTASQHQNHNQKSPTSPEGYVNLEPFRGQPSTRDEHISQFPYKRTGIDMSKACINLQHKAIEQAVKVSSMIGYHPSTASAYQITILKVPISQYRVM
jgi:hypothetical protein